MTSPSTLLDNEEVACCPEWQDLLSNYAPDLVIKVVVQRVFIDPTELPVKWGHVMSR